MNSDTQALVYIVGCGDVGLRVGRLELEAGRAVAALVRSDANAVALSNQGFEIVRGDLDQPGSLHDHPLRPEVLYYFAPPPPTGQTDPRLSAFLDSLHPAQFPGRIVYISTSGVYGDCQGEWVAEDRPLNPRSDRARRRLAAENLIRDWCLPRDIAFVLLRVPGIYGPGRLPVDRISRGVPVLREEESPFSNRIHADDLAAACLAAARRGRSGQAYNVSDGHPSTMTDYFYQIADALELPRPPAISMDEARKRLSPGMLSFLDESKRLDNRRMLSELRVPLRHPDLASGLKTILSDTERSRTQPLSDGPRKTAESGA